MSATCRRIFDAGFSLNAEDLGRSRLRRLSTANIWRASRQFRTPKALVNEFFPASCEAPASMAPLPVLK
jgi:hypothetical protein